MSSKIRILVVGCGHMGTSHARAYHAMSADFEIVGLVARGAGSRQKLNAEFGGRYAEFADYPEALIVVKAFENGPPIAAPIALRLTGPELDVLTALA
ncbi:MAG: Gfo/Idh/MocA family oxidoreductase, partial [Verrucomicrobiota bacterium]